MYVFWKKGKRRIEEPASKQETDHVSARKKIGQYAVLLVSVCVYCNRTNKDRWEKKKKSDDAPLLAHKHTSTMNEYRTLLFSFLVP
jgi:hypothetical protein